MKFSDGILMESIGKGYCYFDGDTIIIKQNKIPIKEYEELAELLKKDGYELHNLHNTVFAIRGKKKNV